MMTDIYNIFPPDFSYVFDGLVGLVVIVALLVILAAMVKRLYRNEDSASYAYRKALANLFVAGKIRQFADKDGVDLEKEDGKLTIWIRSQQLKRTKDFDDKILEQLNTRIDLEIAEKEQELSKKTANGTEKKK